MKTRLMLGLGCLSLMLPNVGMAQVPAGPLTPVAPPRPAIPETKVPDLPQSPRDFPPGSETAPGSPAAAAASGTTWTGPTDDIPELTDGAEIFPEESGPEGYSGGDLIVEEGDPSLYGGVRKKGLKVPKHHIVQEGDTLWGVCNYYYKDPWAWPHLWAFNSNITNPHWIYPGDKIRLLGAEVGRKEPSREKFVVRRFLQSGDTSIRLKQNGFVDPKELEKAGLVEGSKVERRLLVQGDEVYLKGGKKFSPMRGQSYTVYRVNKKLYSSKGKHLGYVVEIQGTARVKRTPQDKAATGVITESVNPIERKQLVGPLRRRYRRLPVKPANKDLAGRVIGDLYGKKHYSLNELVFVDRGRAHGVSNGNRFLVLQRGDGFKRLLQDKDLNNPRFPREAVAELSVIDARDDVSVTVVTRAIKEIKKGAYVKMRRGY